VHTAAAALPPVVKVQTDSFAVAVVVATPAIVPASVRGAEHGRWEPPPGNAHLHVAHCVWLC
jgi:hypothetical protein